MSAITSSKEALSQALQSRIIPNQEYLLQGSVLDSTVEHLKQRLKGLCDNIDVSPELFNDLEICFNLRQLNQTPLMLRARRALDCDMPYQLRYIGQAEMDRSRPTLVRSSIDIGCSSSVLDFLTELGCRIDFEFISRGFMFRKGRMKITVAKIIKIIPGKQHDVGSESLSQSHLVELSVLAPNGHEALSEEMRVFAEQLKPLVQLEKMDYKRLGSLP